MPLVVIEIVYFCLTFYKSILHDRKAQGLTSRANLACVELPLHMRIEIMYNINTAGGKGEVQIGPYWKINCPSPYQGT